MGPQALFTSRPLTMCFVLIILVTRDLGRWMMGVDLDEIKMIQELEQVLPNLKRRDCVLLRMLQSALSGRPKPAPHAFGPGTLVRCCICNNPCKFMFLYRLLN